MRAFFLVFIISSFSVNAQFFIKGTVHSDSSDIALSQVEISMPELGLVCKSDTEGKFRIGPVPKGNHLLTARINGFRVYTRRIMIVDSTDAGEIKLIPGSISISEVVVYGQNYFESNRTSNNIQQLSSDEMRNLGALNLSDGIAKISGVSQLTSGAGISKPIIRGLFGNRIQTVLYGLRFDNQQWQDEHGLGMSDVGVERIEIIKGPASLMYGSEAMGGVVNIIEEKNAPVNTIRSDFSLRAFSNTYGGAGDLGVKGSSEKFNWRLRAGADSHTDYTDGKSQRILNSRFGGYYAKAGCGFNGRKWINKTNYMYAQNNFGFVMDPSQLKEQPDERMSRSFDRPHHTVDLNIFSSQNVFLLPSSKLKLNVGFQNNHRQEQEGGNKVSLDMILNSYIGNLVWNRSLSERCEWSLGSQGFYQTNQNLGTRTIIPDANSYEVSGYSYVKFDFDHWVIEGGARYDIRNVQTFSTGKINTDPLSPGRYIFPVSRTYNALNGSGGVSWMPLQTLHFKMNLSSGYRGPNLAELSSNGLHEGTIRYEIGNTDLKIEQNVCGDVGLYYQSARISFSVSAYDNRFMNYVYLAADSIEYFGFRIYNYRQGNAFIRGIESGISIQPFSSDRLRVGAGYSWIEGKLAGGNSLPFIPAPRLNSELQCVLFKGKKITQVLFRPSMEYAFRQDAPGEFETRTSDYYLIHASLITTYKFQKSEIHCGIAGNNLMNLAYYDHLSRYKYYGVYNVGRNIALNIKFIFN